MAKRVHEHRGYNPTMAALSEPVRRLDIVDLRELRADDLEPLLQEEIRTWDSALDWDFRKSADLVRRFVDLRALNGCALLEGSQAIGYAYFVLEEHKGLIGDLYVRLQSRTGEAENRLLEAVLDEMIGTPHLSRIESQLMMIYTFAGRILPASRFARSHLRDFMVADLTQAALPQGRVRYRAYIEKWAEQYHEPAAQLIASAYLGHVDSHINDQYRSPGGARRFLYNIVQYPGCGTFFRPASLVAFDPEGRICGLCLTSMVAPEVGHVTQICVGNWVRGTGLGYELLRQSLESLREAGCRKVSLTVTTANRDAIQLYQRTGFVTRRQFSAYVWEGF
jgi:ribosomal protein S18 acetylase RimI-like enzyme